VPFCFSPVAALDEQSIIAWENDRIDRSTPSDIPVTPQHAQEHTVQPQTPVPQRSVSGPQSSTIKGKNSRRSMSFPTQKNNLMSWIKSTPQQSTPSIDSISSPSITNPCSINVSPTPAIQAGNSVPLPPAHNMIHSHPTPNLPTSMLPPTPTAQTLSHSPTPHPTASPAPNERTSFKLAEQLRNFRGCTHEQHHEADQLHHEHHQCSDVHSECSSIQQITSILRGSNTGSLINRIFKLLSHSCQIRRHMSNSLSASTASSFAGIK
jgi:hypothetical protein